MNSPPTPSSPIESRLRHTFLASIAIIYCVVFLVHPPRNLSDPVRKTWRWPANQVGKLIESSLVDAGWSRPSTEFRFAIYLLIIGGLIPFLATLAIRRTPRNMGTRLPNVLGIRLTVIGVLVAFPFLVWMAWSESIGEMYLRQWNDLGPLSFSLYYFSIMAVEHWLLQGVVLGWCRRGGRWPEQVTIEQPTGSRFRRLLMWLGLAQSTEGVSGGKAFLRWFGIPRQCLLPIILSGLLFGAVHFGKDPRELLLSFPGGLAQAYLAYRTNSWLTPFAQHILTAWIAFMFM